MDNIIWKDVVGYEGLYQVSNTGLVKSLVRKGRTQEIVMSPKNKKKGYKEVTLYKDNNKSSVTIHQLVAQAFIPNPNNYNCVLHKDDCPPNNHMDNLMWGTLGDNNKDRTNKGRQAKGEKHGRAVLTEQDVLAVRELRSKTGWGSPKISKYLGLSANAVGGVLYNNKWKHV